MKKVVFILIWICLVLSSEYDVLSAGELKFCGVEWPPFTYAENGRIVRGISYDIFTEAFSRLEKSFRADLVPWPRCLKYVKGGMYDAVIDNRAMEPFVSGTTPTAVMPLAIYVRKDFPHDTFSWKLMEGRRVCMVRGYDYPEKILKFEGWKKDFANNEEQMLKVLKKGRYDYVLGDIFSAPILAEKIGADIRMLRPLIDSLLMYLCFNREQGDIMKEYDDTVREMIKDGTMDKIYRKYTQYSYSETMKLVSEEYYDKE